MCLWALRSWVCGSLELGRQVKGKRTWWFGWLLSPNEPTVCLSLYVIISHHMNTGELSCSRWTFSLRQRERWDEKPFLLNFYILKCLIKWWFRCCCSTNVYINLSLLYLPSIINAYMIRHSDVQELGFPWIEVFMQSATCDAETV